jgi:hypothetical protein
LGTPFDTFAYTPDFKVALDDARHINLPNLAIFLWRLAAFRLPLTVPLVEGVTDLGPQADGLAQLVLRLNLDPLNLPVRLFNTSRPGFLSAETSGGVIAPLTDADAVPAPIYDARLTSDSPAGHPDAYIRLDFYDDAATPDTGFDLGDVGLHLFLPESVRSLLVPDPPATEWRWLFRGDNLCAWETGLRKVVRLGEMVIDANIGRLVIGLKNSAQIDTLTTTQNSNLESRIYASFTYGSTGPVGAHPVTRVVTDTDDVVETRSVGSLSGGSTLQTALENLDTATRPVVIEINDSLVHPIDISTLPGTNIDGGFSLRLAQSLTIRAVGEHRPIVLAGGCVRCDTRYAVRAARRTVRGPR